MFYKFGKYIIYKEHALGYDMVDGELVINQAEAEMVKYIFDKRIEYTNNPPHKLIDAVIAEYAEKGTTLTPDEAKKKVSDDQILELIDLEVVSKWESYLKEKAEETKNMSFEKIPNVINPLYKYGDIKEIKAVSGEPIVDYNLYRRVQEMNNEEQSDNEGTEIKLL